MIRDITLGQYYMTDSVVHRMDPRTKLFATFVFVISLFVANNLACYILAAVFLATSIMSCRVPLKFMVRGMKAIALLMAFTVFFNMIMTPGDIIFSFWKINITLQGLKVAVQMAVRLTFLVIGSSIMTLTTTPNNLSDGLEKSMAPFKRIGLPAHEIAMMMSIALRFIPILLEETDKIMKAQLARGADFETGNIFKRAKAMVPILVPLFISAFRRANDLAMAMEARCYRGGEGRTKMKPLKYASRDGITYAVALGYLAVMIAMRIVF